VNANFKHPEKPNNGRMDILENACIVAGYSFFTTLAGVRIAIVMTDWPATLLAAGIAAGLGFFGYLMMAKGLKVRAAK